MEIVELKSVKQLPRDVRLYGYVRGDPGQVETLYWRRFGQKPAEAYQVKVGDVEYIYVPLPQEAK